MQTLWRVYVYGPTGTEAIEVRAPSETAATQQVQGLRPGSPIQGIERRWTAAWRPTAFLAA